MLCTLEYEHCILFVCILFVCILFVCILFVCLLFVYLYSMDINDQNSLGYTLLMYNVNNAYNVLALLELGAITDLKNIYGSTALIEASNNNYLEIGRASCRERV